MEETLVEPLSFRVQGQRVMGHLHRPRNTTRLPGLIIGGPMTSVKEQVTGVYAAALAAHGFAALALDHRHFGQSEGQPRQLEVHGRKVEDLLAAIDVLAAHPAVDARQLAGVAGYYRNPAEMRAADATGFDAKVEQGRHARLHHEATGEVLMIPAAAPFGDAAMQTADTVDY